MGVSLLLARDAALHRLKGSEHRRKGLLLR